MDWSISKILINFWNRPPIFCEMDWSGFEPEASPVQGERYTRFNYQPLDYTGCIQY